MCMSSMRFSSSASLAEGLESSYAGGGPRGSSAEGRASAGETVRPVVCGARCSLVFVVGW